eukprot:scaffold375725_cov20-Prasinocladus_malaysianus.AAC.1
MMVRCRENKPGIFSQLNDKDLTLENVCGMRVMMCNTSVNSLGAALAGPALARCKPPPQAALLFFNVQ